MRTRTRPLTPAFWSGWRATPSASPLTNEDHSAEAIRLVQISLETDTVGDTVWAALEEVVNEGQASDVMRMVQDPNVAEDVQEHFWTHLATAANMRILLNNEPRDTMWWRSC